MDRSSRNLKIKAKITINTNTFSKRLFNSSQINASITGLGAVLLQTQNNIKVVIVYASRAFADTEQKSNINEIESLAVHWTITENFIYI
jgi:hypothetical protein